MEDNLTLRQQRALAICPKISASISIPCSCFIIYEVWIEHQRNKSTAVQRALLAMSVVDILASSAWFLSTWAVPKSSGFAFAAGNQTTCNFQGFLLQLAIGAPLYNSSLALFYLLMIKMRWTDSDLLAMERCVHFFIGTFTVGTSLLLLPLQQYNHIGAVCWVIGDPVDCGNSSYQSNPDVDCQRGDHAWIYGLALFYIPLWVCVIACCLSMVCLYREVRVTHRKSQRYVTNLGIDQPQRKSAKDTDRVAMQAILYSLSFLITWMPSTLWSVAHWFNFNSSAVYGLSLAAAIAEPLQGLWNFLIFLRSRPRTLVRLQTLLGSFLPSLEVQSSYFRTSVNAADATSGNYNCKSEQPSAFRSSRTADDESTTKVVRFAIQPPRRMQMDSSSVYSAEQNSSVVDNDTNTTEVINAETVGSGSTAIAQNEEEGEEQSTTPSDVEDAVQQIESNPRNSRIVAVATEDQKEQSTIGGTIYDC